MKGVLTISIVLSIFCSHTRGQFYKSPLQNSDTAIPPLKTTGLFGASNYGTLTASLPSLLTSNMFPAGSAIKSIFSRNPFLSAHSAFASPITRFFQSPLFIRPYSNPKEVEANSVPATYNNAVYYPQVKSDGPTGDYPQSNNGYPQQGPNYPNIGQGYPYQRPDYGMAGPTYSRFGPNYPNMGLSQFAIPSLEKAPTPFNLESPQPPKRIPPPSLPQYGNRPYGPNVFPAGVPISTKPQLNYGNQQPRYQQPVDVSEQDYNYEVDDDSYQIPVSPSPNPVMPSYGQPKLENPRQTSDNYMPQGNSNYKLSLRGPPVLRYFTSSKPPAVVQKEMQDNYFVPNDRKESQPVEDEAVVYAGPLPKSNDGATPHATYITNADEGPKLNYQTATKPELPQYKPPSNITPTPYEMVVDYNYDGTYPDSNSVTHQTDDESKADTAYLKYPNTQETNEVTADGHAQPIPLQDAPEEYEPVNSDAFSCIGRTAGHYGDAGHGCQVFHICQSDGRHDTFYCPKGTLFNKETNVCDFPYKSSGAC